jgi:hypothetical protein
MSAAITAAIGVGTSIYSGIKQGKAHDAANGRAEASLAANMGVANELKARDARLVDPVIEKQLAELQSSKITAAGQMGLDRFNAEMGNADRTIAEQAPMAGEGVTGGRQLTQQFRRAQGIAGINLEDRAKKETQLPGMLSIASRTPAWVGIATGANTQMAGFQENLANQAGQAQQSAYGAAAQGMMGLAKLYADGAEPQTSTTPLPEVTSNVNLVPANPSVPNRNPSYVDLGMTPGVANTGMVGSSYFQDPNYNQFGRFSSQDRGR